MTVHFRNEMRSEKSAQAMLLGLALLIVALSLLMAGCQLAQKGAKDPSPRGCAECHVNITRQWAASAHAIAWTNPDFDAETRSTTTRQCLPCHASEPVLEMPVDEPIALREQRREDGVDCVTCHRAGDAYAGPYKSLLGPHEVTQTRRMICSSFCGTCHEVEALEHETLYAPVARSRGAVKHCVHCHMPARMERLTQGHVLSLIHPRRPVRDHSFPIWSDRIIRGAIEVTDAPTFEREDLEYKVKFTLTNRGAGHRIPTGGYGHREVRIVIELMDQAGHVVGEKERSLFAGRGTGLAPDRVTPFSYHIEITDGAKPVTARLLIEVVNRDRTERHPLLDRQWELPSELEEGSSFSRALLVDAGRRISSSLVNASQTVSEMESHNCGKAVIDIAGFGLLTNGLESPYLQVREASSGHCPN